MKLQFLAPILAMLWAPALEAEPLAIHDRGNLRVDFSITWTQAGPATGTVVPNDFAFTPSDSGLPVTVHSGSPGSMTVITGGGGYFTSGPLLAHPAPGDLIIYPLRKLQGFGVTIESSFGEHADYSIECLTASSVTIGTATAVSSGTSGEPVFLGVMDPDARIEIIRLHSGPSGPNAFVLSNPVFQLAREPSDDPRTLPVAGHFAQRIDAKATYLHEGISGDTTPATNEASVDNPNVVDLLGEGKFPGLRGGDVLRFQGSFSGGTNPALGLLSRTQVIRAGTAIVRVPGALNAGFDFPTPPSTHGSIATPTDIGSDFVIGSSSFVEAPSGSHYLMLSLAQPSNSGIAGSVQVSWIPRALFENWLLTHGLAGGLAALTADPDGDGLSNIEEFAYGKDPTAGDAGTVNDFAFAPFSRLMDPTGHSTALQLTFGARRAAPLRFRPAFSSDLLDWDIGAPEAVVPTVFSEGGTQAVFVTTDPAPPGGTRRFGRILVEFLPTGQ